MWNKFFPYKILKLSFLDYICQNVNNFFFHALYHINVSQDIDSIYEILKELYIDINI